MPYTNAGTQRSYVMPVLAIVAAVLQVALAPQVSILGGRFNFMLAFAVAVALRGDATQAVYAGFFSGLFYDLTATVPIGLMALIPPSAPSRSRAWAERARAASRARRSASRGRHFAIVLVNGWRSFCSASRAAS